MKITAGQLRQIIREELNLQEKKDPKAKVRNRGDVVFPAGSSKVLDDNDHYPVNTEKEARAALGYVNHYKQPPSWYDGSLESMVKKVVNKVKRNFSNIKVSAAAEKPGKG
jgi:hypothetical protein